jgi:pyruvate formate lyase activating enzyme
MKKEAMLWEKGENTEVNCRLCAHRCSIKSDRFGICGVRKNEEGTLNTFAYGNPIAMHTDPIEKKPLYHFMPGSLAFSIATIGCNFKCEFCQNWRISQTRFSDGEVRESQAVLPEMIVNAAQNNGCQSIAYTYTEPTIFFEYAYDTARLAREKGIKNVFVTNGFMTGEALEKISPYLDAANVDLKSFSDSYYKRTCGGRLQPVLDSISKMHELGVWVEVTTLIVPGDNDSPEELDSIAGFISGVSTEIPWHISRFHPDYQYTGVKATPLETLSKAEETGKKHGLKFIHKGNV